MLSAKVTAIVLDWNGEAATRRCLASLVAQDWPGLRVLVVDNGSQPPSRVEAEVLRLERNHGFAGGMNRGAAKAIADGATHILLLNNDAVLAPDCVRRLLEASIPIAAPTIVAGLPPAEGPLWYAGGSLSRWTGEPRHHTAPPADERPRLVGFASGCCLLVDVAAWRVVGGLDERYFLYYEDVDFCLRAADAGVPIGWVPAARAWHEGGASTGSQAAKAPALDYYDARNAIKLINARLGLPQRLVATWWWSQVRMPRKLARILLRGPNRRASLAAALRGAAHGLVDREGPMPGG